MKIRTIAVAIGVSLALTAARANAVIVLDFEGIGDVQPVGDFYNGGAGGNLGISFSSNALAVIDRDAGGSGNFGGEPSPSTALFFLSGSAATLNIASGFTTGFSFFYSAVNNPGFITVFDGLNATGNVLATLPLPVTPFDGAPDPTGNFSPLLPIGVSFSGTARSINFGGAQNQIAFDNITFGSSTPTVPDAGATLTLLGLAVFVIAAAQRTLRRA
jgi:hypothetical protein